MFIVVVIALFTASVTSRLTAVQLRVNIRDAQDLAHIRTGVVKDSRGDEFLQRQGISRRQFDNVESALSALVKRDVDAVLYDQLTLRYLIAADYESNLTVFLNRLDQEDHAFAFPSGSPMIEPVNRALLEQIRSEIWKKTLQRYLGQAN